MIRTVIFDLSEVLIPGLIGVEAHLERETGKPADLIAKAMGSYPYYEIGNSLDNLLKGDLTYIDYRTSILSQLELPERSAEIFDLECLKMFETPYRHTEEMLATTAKNCRLFLLSDHVKVWAEHIVKKHGFLSLFEGILWSYEVGATKKTAKPFAAILEKYRLLPETCLFVDDNEINISIADGMGFNTVHFKGEESVEQVFSAIKK